MDRVTLPYPKHYYVVEEGEKRILYRPDGTEVLHFDNTIARSSEIALAAFEDHSKRLSGNETISHVEYK